MTFTRVLTTSNCHIQRIPADLNGQRQHQANSWIMYQYHAKGERRRTEQTKICTEKDSPSKQLDNGAGPSNKRDEEYNTGQRKGEDTLFFLKLIDTNERHELTWYKATYIYTSCETASESFPPPSAGGVVTGRAAAPGRVWGRITTSFEPSSIQAGATDGSVHPSRIMLDSMTCESAPAPRTLYSKSPTRQS